MKTEKQYRHLLFRMAILLVATLSFFTVGCDRADEEATYPENPEWVTLTIKHESVREFAPVSWHHRMTVFDLLAKIQARDSVSIEYQGSADRLFVTAIDGFVADRNSKKGWIFSVNGERGDKSCGIYRVEPNDSILWEYEDTQ